MQKLRVAMIGGGGPESFFGGVHQRAIALDATRELVAGALRSDPAKALAAADAMGVQGYPDYRAMLDDIVSGKLTIDYVTVVTPNHVHYEPVKAFLENGIPVVCEKPMTMTVAEAEELGQLVEQNDVPFLLAHTYTGHPMMMLARQWVADGMIGEIRKVESWYLQGWLADPLEKEEVKQAAWRTDPARAGLSCCGGDIGTHAFVAATWVTGLAVSRVSARLNTFVSGRSLDDDFNTVCELENGATALINATQIAIGHKNDHGFRIYGNRGSLEWHQERAECLLLNRGNADELYWTGAGNAHFPDSIGSYLRVPAGHNEDFFEALANLHCTMERRIRARRGEKDVPAAFAHPGVHEGITGMRFVAAAVASSKAEGVWTRV